MSKFMRAVIVAALAMGMSSVASAQGMNQKNLFFGAGLGSNSVSGASGTGFQFFGGYGFGEVSPKLNVDAEVGYMDTGSMKKDVTVCYPFPIGCVSTSIDAKAKGLWANGVGRYRIAPQVELIGRAGLDFGDDDGFMWGVGGGYLVNRNVTLRAEYVVRQHVDSLQFNFVYRQ